MRRTSIIDWTALAVVATVMVVPQLASADAVSALRCERGIAKAYGRYVSTRSKIVQRCKDGAVRRGTPASPTDCPTSADDTRLGQAEAKLASQIASSCGGDNRLCSTTDVGADADEPLADIGWDIGACPDLGAEGCTAAIAHCGDIATCLECVAHEAVDQGTGIAYDQLASGEFDTGSAVNDCQVMLGKASNRFSLDRARQLGACWDKTLRGAAGFVVPPGCPATDSLTIGRLARAEQRKIAAICKACGAGGDSDGDGQCDAPATAFGAAAIGFEPDCPDVIVPSSSRACGFSAVSTLAQVIDCVDCVVEYLTDCGGALSVPAATGYPAACLATP